MPRGFVAAALIVTALALTGCRQSAPVQNISNSSFGSLNYAGEKKLTLEDYSKAIVLAGSKRGWTFNSIAPNHLEGTLNVRGKHHVDVDIVFDTNTYSITYRDSRGLEYDAATDTIHPNYNKWVNTLDQDIRLEVQKLQAS
ncbi:hypothetical protein KHP62_03635 [Rhodobacteraceae bacterium NNCM2]|nr:hypothetical protein [Coraliihabitans acroporae]